MRLTVKTRFAPSPTGNLHLGSLRTALFNWLWARKHHGQFIVRLEDTDQNRLVKGASQKILADLKQMKLDWDYGPDKAHPEFGSCIQSQRLELYQETAQKLIENNLAYYDYTSAQDLENLRRQAQAQKQAFVFRKSMAQLKASNATQKPTIRVSLPDRLELGWQDVIKGQQSWQSQDIGDFIIIKSDGWPTYHLANVVDDHHMQISHVIRADEWLSSTPKHLFLFDRLGWSRPTYVHVPPILASTGQQKLSKRQQASQISDLLEQGYMPKAILNYISLLGWNPKTPQEIFEIEALVKAFEIDQIQVSGARFDADRLNWFNGQHIRKLNKEALRSQASNWWPAEAQKFDQAYKDQVLEITYQRLKKWSELAELTDFFFSQPQPMSVSALSQATKFDSKQIQVLLNQTLTTLEASDFSLGDLELKLYQLAMEAKISPGKYFMLLRLKLTARKVAPGLFETIHVLGRDQCRERLQI